MSRLEDLDHAVGAHIAHAPGNQDPVLHHDVADLYPGNVFPQVADSARSDYDNLRKSKFTNHLLKCLNQCFLTRLTTFTVASRSIVVTFHQVVMCHRNISVNNKIFNIFIQYELRIVYSTFHAKNKCLNIPVNVYFLSQFLSSLWKKEYMIV